MNNINQKVASENDKKLALLEQKLGFKDKQLKDDIEKYEREIADLKKVNSDHSQFAVRELEEKLEQALKSKENYKKKFEESSNKLKEQESSLGSETADLRTQKALLEERLNNIQRRLEESDKNYKDKLEASVSDIVSKLTNLQTEKDNLLAQIKEKDSKIQEQDDKIYDITSAYDREKALLEEQVKHYKSNAEATKRELKEDRERFQITMQQFNKKGEIEKSKDYQNNHLIVDTMDKRHKEQLATLGKNLKGQIDELKKANIELKEENKSFKNQLHSEQMDNRTLQKANENYEQKLKELESKVDNGKENMINEYNERVSTMLKQKEEEREEFMKKLDEKDNELKKYRSKYDKLNIEME